MFCKKCGTQLDENAVVCTNCRDAFAVNAQKQKIGAISAQQRDVMLKRMNGPLMLVMAICFSVVLLCTLINAILGGIFSILSAILPLVFMIIATVGLWKCVAAKSGSDIAGTMNKASIYDAYQRVMMTIVQVLLWIFFGIITIAIFVVTEDVTDVLSGYGFYIFTVVYGGFIAIVTVLKNIYAGRREYFIAVGNAYKKGEYNLHSVPTFGSYVLATFQLLSVVPALLLSRLSVILGDYMDEMLGSLGEFDAGEIVDTIMGGLATSILLSAILGLATGLYYIFSAIWMSSVHSGEAALRKQILAERSVLGSLETKTKDVLDQIDRQKRREEAERQQKIEDERKAAELEAKKAQADIQNQQQMMMQMMMQQMIKNGINVSNIPNMPNMAINMNVNATSVPVGEFNPSAENHVVAEGNVVEDLNVDDGTGAIEEKAAADETPALEESSASE